MRIFLDANIIFSAAKENSPIRQLLEILAQRTTLISHPFALKEAHFNLSRKKPLWMEGYTSLIKKIKISNETKEISNVQLHEKDYPILCAAIGAQCSHLLTGDFRHFGHLLGKTVHNVKIVSAKMLLEEIEKKGWL